MSELVADCPRCGAGEMTFDVYVTHPTVVQYGWQHWWEAFSICRRCNRCTIFVLVERDTDHQREIKAANLMLTKLSGALNVYCRVESFICVADLNSGIPPEHLPEDLTRAFAEGAKCQAIGCYNAAAAMYRLCVDIATRSLLPEGEVEGLNARTRRDLGLRLPWLFDHGHLPKDLRDLSACIREDGNDGVHAGTLEKADAEDLHDFTFELLDRMYTEPERLRLAKERRDQRRGVPIKK